MSKVTPLHYRKAVCKIQDRSDNQIYEPEEHFLINMMLIEDFEYKASTGKKKRRQSYTSIGLLIKEARSVIESLSAAVEKAEQMQMNKVMTAEIEEERRREDIQDIIDEQNRGDED